ncbi:MAG: GNAT family N-acetyltransferase [Defluviitaleaceae bacterium]|nr:GNAT family N-acetyltransferase [Defluviitaleaceae bacterium]
MSKGKREVYAENQLVRLVETRKKDAQAAFENWQDPDTIKGFNGRHVRSIQQYRAKFEDWDSGKWFFYCAVQEVATGEIVGCISVSNEPHDLAIWLFAPHRGRGLGVAAFSLATNYVTEALDVERLYAGAMEDNLRAQAMLKKCGYIPHPVGNFTTTHYETGEEFTELDHIYIPPWQLP